MNKTALITGASSGIGRATAQIFTDNNIQVILCGRSAGGLQETVSSFQDGAKFICLEFDVSDFNAAQKAIETLPNEFKKVDILVNNAGNAHGLGPIQAGELSDWEAMIDSNIKGLLNVSKIIMPQMVSRNQGHIVNLSSIAGKAAYPNGNVYCATKAAVEAISASMRIDLNAYNIKVTNIAPGAVDTNFSTVRFKGDVNKAKDVYKGYTPLYAEDIADVILFAVTRPAHVQIADLLILPTAQASATVVNRAK
jgi:3-hydroxy acid dehydrogenase / malonic semialdehyde reductase